MKAFKLYYLAIFFISLSIYSCNFSDKTENLGGDYFYRNEGETIKDILCEKANGGEIPATVLSFEFNNEFIIAKQKPKLPQDPMYDNDYEYNKGEDVLYYWIIVKKTKDVLGPLSLGEFNNMRIKHHVPKDLILK